MTVKTNIQALRDALVEEMRRNESIVVLGEDVGVRGGVFRATEGLIFRGNVAHSATSQ